MEGVKVTAGVRKAKKKQVKDEIDRIKQAEKKKRRLEKALATSAAIQAVALHVLLGEDSDDSSRMMLKKDEGLASWDHDSSMDIIVGAHSLVPYQDLSRCSLENIGWVSDGQRYGRVWNHWGNSNLMVSSDAFGRDIYPQYLAEEGWGSVGLSAGHLAAQAVSSLKIAAAADEDAYMFNRVLRG
ncbi:hypothetical protein C2S52_008937 [Perilla frutescens var. hirtella]|uniref:Uncharacterized protein n=1 Tax=Perilla frutescens var. hirtella TaxID=608512 RepID=A0AAD4P6M1_PERFH|nr:hypothetical protein C2S51_017524 [Perilla frutescens var. frutescens]KAH6783978.1 hypothetical protein C2S52_008937 [Perilla frutescens var. hirtella]KAH6828863.1 hypothetical protein C2S53_013701 [Perilla frutescens var. hirtella]